MGFGKLLYNAAVAFSLHPCLPSSNLAPVQQEVPAIALDLSCRADLAEYPELMDQPCSYEDLRACLRDIARVNRLTRAYDPTIRWLDHFYASLPFQKRPIHIVDVGCGYGDMLRRIHVWALDRSVPVILTGIDLNPDAVRAAREATIPGTVTFLSSDAFDFDPPGGIDLVISSLLMHHLDDATVVDFLLWMESVTRFGWFINDLHRQALPHYAFRVMAAFSNWHPFVKHDGAVSILRSFRPADWCALLKAAGIPRDQVLISVHRPARLCVARLR